jgi:hypothetical protein
MTEQRTWRCPRCGVDVIRDLPGRCPDKLCPPVPDGVLDPDDGKLDTDDPLTVVAEQRP